MSCQNSTRSGENEEKNSKTETGTERGEAGFTFMCVSDPEKSSDDSNECSLKKKKMLAYYYHVCK